MPNENHQSALSMIPEESKSIQDSRNNHSVRQSADHLAKSHSKKMNVKDCQTQTELQNINTALKYQTQATENKRYSNVLPPTNSNQLLLRQDSGNMPQNFEIQQQSLKNIHWFKWDSTEVYRLNNKTCDWEIRSEIKNMSKFLFFSSVVHLPNDQGCFILGGSDNEDNYSKRVQYFCKYNLFIEKPPMINKRAFFPSVFAKLDNSLYVLGGSDSNQSDLNKCEKFSLQENVWRPIAPMNLSRNGTAAVILEQYRLIFVIGGNNHKHGSLSKIEKYEVDFDKWSIIDITIRTAIHDLSALCVGKERVLVFGGHTNTEPNKEIQLVDLSLECFKTKIGKSKFMLKDGGKTYFPPCFDSQSGKVQIFFGYCDDKPKIEEVDISELAMITSSSNYQPQSENPSRRESINKINNGSNERRSQSLNRTGLNPMVEL